MKASFMGVQTHFRTKLVNVTYISSIWKRNLKLKLLEHDVRSYKEHTWELYAADKARWVKIGDAVRKSQTA